MTRSSPPKDIQGLYYITHKDNVRSILRHGILSHRQIEKHKMSPEHVYDEQIIARRGERLVADGKSLWDYANLFFQARNPMLYRVFRKENQPVVVLGLRRDVLNSPDAYVAVGNAAAAESEIFPVKEGKGKILENENWKRIHAKYWHDYDGGKRVIMAELLVPDAIPASLIDAVYVPDKEIQKEMEALLPGKVILEPHMFILPSSKKGISGNLSLLGGDMFFSGMHTFTISVNTQGVMGKGLASRAKYQFPDVYVKYQDACRSKRLTAEKPYLYKREVSLEAELSDAPETLVAPNDARWFLLFATKRDWRRPSRLSDIEGGLHWIVKNFEKEGIKSLALPALGCGLGGLSWSEVGPLMCRMLSPLDLQSAIYLPQESDIPAEQKTSEFLLGK